MNAFLSTELLKNYTIITHKIVQNLFIYSTTNFCFMEYFPFLIDKM